MKRFIIPLIAVVLFFIEPVFSLFSPIELGEVRYTLVPRFVIIYLVFISSYYSQRTAIIYGLCFGLLYDVYHSDIIGVYTLFYTSICFFSSVTIRRVHRSAGTVMLMSLIMVLLLEVASYVFASFAGMTSIGFSSFWTTRLVPTMIANSVFILFVGWLFKNLLYTRDVEKQSNMKFRMRAGDRSVETTDSNDKRNKRRARSSLR